MEMYFYPPDGDSEAGLAREQVLAALSAQGLKASGQEEGSFWVVRFEGSDAFLQCQVLRPRAAGVGPSTQLTRSRLHPRRLRVETGTFP